MKQHTANESIRVRQILNLRGDEAKVKTIVLIQWTWTLNTHTHTQSNNMPSIISLETWSLHYAQHWTKHILRHKHTVHKHRQEFSMKSALETLAPGRHRRARNRMEETTSLIDMRMASSICWQHRLLDWSSSTSSQQEGWTDLLTSW